MGCIREKGTERWDPQRSRSQSHGSEERSEVSWEGALTGISPGTKPKANAFKLLHWQQEVQGSNEGLSDALTEKESPCQEGAMSELKDGEWCAGYVLGASHFLCHHVISCKLTL